MTIEQLTARLAVARVARKLNNSEANREELKNAWNDLNDATPKRKVGGRRGSRAGQRQHALRTSR